MARSLEPRGALPHSARVLDANEDPSEYEASVDVELLGVDATSFRVLRQRCDDDPARVADAIGQIVAERGKLQNPWTGSGGVLMGRVEYVGPSYSASRVSVADRVVPLASLIAIPLRVSSVGPVDLRSTQVPVRGRAIVTGGMACAPIPADLPAALALSVFDVFPAASYARELATTGQHMLVLGAGHAGLLALAAGRDAVGDEGRLTVVDVSADALARARAIDPAVTAIAADVTNPLAVAGELAANGLERADLTLLCTTVSGAEGTALLATADRGTIVFFSTATTFSAAALGADAIGSQARLLIPNGLTDDRGDYALGLVRRIPMLRDALEGRA